MSDQLPLFEGNQPEAVRLTVTGSSDTNQNPELPALKLDQRVTFMASGVVTKVTHARTKDDTLERQHVVVIDALTFREEVLDVEG